MQRCIKINDSKILYFIFIIASVRKKKTVYCVYAFKAKKKLVKSRPKKKSAYEVRIIVLKRQKSQIQHNIYETL